MAIEPPPPMDATNQAQERIKGQNVGNVFGGRRCAERGATRKRVGVLTDLSSAAGLVPATAPEGVITLVCEPPSCLAW